MMSLLTFKYIIRLMKGLAVLVLMLLALLFFAIVCSKEDKPELIETSTTDRKLETKNMKFILLWTDSKATPFAYFGKGSSIFKAKSCKYTNCYVTPNRRELGDVSMFDAILFNGPQLKKMFEQDDFPKSRSVGQKYVYASIESAQNYPICSKEFNGFFNWTWTYRLDSDTNWGYFVVKNKTSNDVVAPSIDAQWIDPDSMDDIDEVLKKKLKNKEKAAAWFVSNCRTSSRREVFNDLVRKYLKNYNYDVHVYGKCGGHECPAYIHDRCLRALSAEYFFYFAFENALSVDYVTEKILNAYRHNTVPVVYGGANYSRFLPPGSYINAIELGPEKLANTINHLMKNPEEYYKYFRWQKYYSFHNRHESPETDDYCKFCKVLNDRSLVETTSIHGDVDEWWNEKHSCEKRFTRTNVTEKRNILRSSHVINVWENETN